VAWFVGLMSGTSLDGVDGVLAEAPPGQLLQARAHVHRPFDAALRASLLYLNTTGPDEIHRGALAANALMRLYAEVVAQLLQAAGLNAGQVRAMGAHGQTVRHRPGEFDGTGYTVQLINGALLAELTGIDVVCDFRSRDVAAGGQGAPLVPAFHAACFGRPDQDVAVLNVGGIANLTLLPAQGPVGGFDCGPGNVLMDLWCQRHRGQAFDADGAWASSGRVRPDLLAHWLDDPYFDLPPPKSTGRDLFHAGWLAARSDDDANSADVMATLAELTAASAVLALNRYAPRTKLMLVCGGGAHNRHLMNRLARLVGAGVTVQRTAEVGVPPDQVEALAFAWLAQRFVNREPGNLPAVTGGRGARLLGALYPAG
jgi:anhydro-N-acetylmuramic acid kinase